MPLDDESRRVLDQLAAIGGFDYVSMTPQELRAAGVARRPAIPAETVQKIEDRAIPGPNGDIPVRIYTHSGAAPLGCLVWFHGGGWVLGDLEGVHALCAAITNRAACVTVSVDYRLAPEHKFPVPFEDCYAVTAWVAAHAAELNVDPRRIAVGGDSAGGNLAAAVCLAARDRGGPGICFQLLAYPVIDHRFDTPSYADNAEGYLLTKEMMVWFWDCYLRSATDGKNPYASPLRAEDLGRLPRGMIMTAEYDPLRDEGAAFANRLRDAGVEVTLRRYDGTIHGFLGMFPVLKAGQLGLHEATLALREAFRLAVA